jgi:nitrite reductase/ring-hydroxylating ferredoxin subunit
MAKVEEVIAPDKTYQGMRFNHDEMHIVCPWHGWEYDLATGVMVADRKFRLRKYEVEERGGAVYVHA